MDKNSVIGLVVIGGILIGWMFLSRPSAQEQAKVKHLQDSVVQFDSLQKVKLALTSKSSAPSASANKNTSSDSTIVLTDSAKAAIQHSAYGDFVNASKGENKIITIENEVMKVNVSSKG